MGLVTRAPNNNAPLILFLSFCFPAFAAISALSSFCFPAFAAISVLPSFCFPPLAAISMLSSFCFPALAAISAFSSFCFPAFAAIFVHRRGFENRELERGFFVYAECGLEDGAGVDIYRDGLLIFAHFVHSFREHKAAE